MTAATRLLAVSGLVALAAVLLGGCTIEAADPGVRYTQAPQPALGGLDRACRPLAERQVRMVGERDLTLVVLDTDAERARSAQGYRRVADLGRSTLARLDRVRPRPPGYARFRRAFEAAHVTSVEAVADALGVTAVSGVPLAVGDAVDLLEAASGRLVRQAERIGAPGCGAASVVPGLTFPPALPEPPEVVAAPAPAPDGRGGGSTLAGYSGLGVVALVPFLIGFPIGLLTSVGVRAGLVVAGLGGAGTAVVVAFGDSYLNSRDGDLFDVIGEIFFVAVVGVAAFAVAFVGLGLVAGAVVRRRSGSEVR